VLETGRSLQAADSMLGPLGSTGNTSFHPWTVMLIYHSMDMIIAYTVCVQAMDWESGSCERPGWARERGCM
jgi:hypothetical protein